METSTLFRLTSGSSKGMAPKPKWTGPSWTCPVRLLLPIDEGRVHNTISDCIALHYIVHYLSVLVLSRSFTEYGGDAGVCSRCHTCH